MIIFLTAKLLFISLSKVVFNFSGTNFNRLLELIAVFVALGPLLIFSSVLFILLLDSLGSFSGFGIFVFAAYFAVYYVVFEEVAFTESSASSASDSFSVFRMLLLSVGDSISSISSSSELFKSVFFCSLFVVFPVVFVGFA